MIDFSVLVMSVPSRIRTFTPNLLEALNEQIEKTSANVEVLCLYDNKKRSVGEKRNDMLSLANGEYFAFVDDDDRIADDYIESITNSINESRGCDCIVYDCICTIDGGPPRYCQYGIEYPPNNLISQSQWRGKPAHTMTWRTELVKSIDFPPLKEGEDFAWVNKAWPLIDQQVRIEKVLYYYDFSHATTETRN